MNCPRCGYKVDQDFGVFTCPQCQAVLFIDLDGNVQISEPNSSQDSDSIQGMSSLGESSPGEHQQNSPIPTEEPPSFQVPVPPVPQVPKMNIPPQMPLPPPPPKPSTQKLGLGQPQRVGFVPPQKTSATPIPGASAPPLQRSTVAPVAASAPRIPGPPASIGVPQAPALVPENPFMPANKEAKFSVSDLAKEISDFANDNEDPQLMSYEISIEGIDTSELRQKVLDALSDNRFHWESRVLLAQIKNGYLKLPRLNPAKAMVLVRRLQALPITISWNQFRL